MGTEKKIATVTGNSMANANTAHTANIFAPSPTSVGNRRQMQIPPLTGGILQKTAAGRVWSKRPLSGAGQVKLSLIGYH